MNKTNFKVKSNLSEIKEKIEDASKEKAEEAAKELQEEIKKELGGSGHGKQYQLPTGTESVRTRIGKRTVTRRASSSGGVYRASEPGESPAKASGLLQSSFGYYTETSRGVHGKNITTHVGSPLDYALFLEKGTGDMAPRRYFHPTYNRKKRDMKGIMEDRWFR